MAEFSIIPLILPESIDFSKPIDLHKAETSHKILNTNAIVCVDRDPVLLQIQSSLTQGYVTKAIEMKGPFVRLVINHPQFQVAICNKEYLPSDIIEAK